MDAAFEHGAGRRPCDRIREGQVPQPLHRPAADGHSGQRATGFLLHQEDGRHIRDHGGELERSRAGRHPLRAADPVGEAGRRRLPRDRRRLRDHLGRYGHRAHRPDVRRRRRPRGQGRRHPAALHGRPRGQEPADGRQAGQILFDRRPRPGVREDARRRREIRGVCGPLREERLRRAAERDRPDAGHRHRGDAESRKQGLQDREAHPLLPPLLAHGQTCALLPARLVVHPHHGAARADDRTEQNDPLEPRIDRNGPLRQVARRTGGLEPLAFALLGNPAARMGHGGLLRGEVHRFGRRTDDRNRAFDSGGRHAGKPVQEFQGRRHVEGELLDREHRPAPPLCRFDRAGLVEGRADEARIGPDRRVVRLGRHALCAGALPVREQGGLRPGLPRRLHRRGRRPDARLVLHAARHRLDAFRLGGFQEYHFERSGAGQERQQDVETPGQRRRSVRGARHLRSRRDALVHDLQLAAVGQPQVRQGRRRRSAPQILRNALQHLLVLRPLRQRGRLHGP